MSGFAALCRKIRRFFAHFFFAEQKVTVAQVQKYQSLARNTKKNGCGILRAIGRVPKLKHRKVANNVQKPILCGWSAPESRLGCKKRRSSTPLSPLAGTRRGPPAQRHRQTGGSKGFEGRPVARRPKSPSRPSPLARIAQTPET